MLRERGNFEIMLQIRKIYQWSEQYNMYVLCVLCTINLLHSVWLSCRWSRVRVQFSPFKCINTL